MEENRIYLAGPEVFLPDVKEIGEKKKELCLMYNFIGIFPFDAEVDINPDNLREAGLKISRINEQLIESCNYVIANLTPFRGPSADVGTVYEIGFATGLGRKVIGYSNMIEEYKKRVIDFYNSNIQTDSQGILRDPDGMSIENFELNDNLMIDGSMYNHIGIMFHDNVHPAELYTNLDLFEKCLQFLQSIHNKG